MPRPSPAARARDCSGAGAAPEGPPEQLRSISESAARALLADAAALLGRSAEQVALRGRPEQEVVAAAARADLLVLSRDGDRGRPGPKSIGHAARFVLDHVHVPGGARLNARQLARAGNANWHSPCMAVTAPVSTVDPPDLSFGPTARHLTREWWVERRLVGIGLVCALATTALGIAIPVLVQRVIDNSIVAEGPLRARALPRADRGLRAAALRDQLDAAGDHLAHRHRDREPPAREALRRVPDLSARVLRPPRDRAGALARDQRPLPDPLLHRLGRRAGRARA